MAAVSIADDCFVGEWSDIRHIQPNAHQHAAAIFRRLDLVSGAAMKGRVVVAELNVAGLKRKRELHFGGNRVDEIQ